MRRLISAAAFVAVYTVGFFLLVIPSAAAYIDFGSGSLLFQAIIGGLMAAGLTLATFWRRLTNFFRRK